MRSASVAAITELARERPGIHLLTADLGFKVLDPFREAFPDRFTNVGVQEANMISVAAGLALGGARPICYSMVPFLFFRAFEQVRVDVVEPRLPVLLLGVGGGLSYGHEGTSHHAIEDIAIARSLPGLTVIAPGDPLETRLAVRYALDAAGPTFIRLGKNGDPPVHVGDVTDVARALVVCGEGERTLVLATGHILHASQQAAALLAARGTLVKLVSVPMLKPFPVDDVRRMAAAADVVVTIEEHSVIGGLGTEVAELLLEERYAGSFLKIGLPDAYCTKNGSLEWLRAEYRLDALGLAGRIAEHLS
jgi:transketolase